MENDEISTGLAPLSVVELAEESIRSLYKRALDRYPSQDEVSPYLQALKDGARMDDLVASIFDSEEAVLLAESRSRLLVERPLPALTIGAEDVLGIIRQGYELAGHSDVAHFEVMEAFGRFQAGQELATIFKVIADGRSGAAVQRLESDAIIDDAIRVLYKRILKRPAGDEEVGIWRNVYYSSGSLGQIILDLDNSPEAKMRAGGGKFDYPVGRLIQLAFETLIGRGASPFEVDHYRSNIECGDLSFSVLLDSFFRERAGRRFGNLSEVEQNDPTKAYLFGSLGVVDAGEVWGNPPQQKRPTSSTLGENSLIKIKDDDECVVSIITSLYCGGDYIEAFLDMITRQTIFSRSELIIIDANSPENEGAVINRYQERFPNIIYHRAETRIGIYEAWNLGVKMAKGRYCTNANLDDIRRDDSMEIQASILDTLDFIDVAYQDVCYSFEFGISFDDIAAHQLITDLPVITRYNLMEFNSPHNAPLWRRALHQEVGYFNEDYKSAADFEFWLRCARAGKKFYKSNEAHVAYFVNPQGLSTRADTRGVAEAHDISNRLYSGMISECLTAEPPAFAKRIGGNYQIDDNDLRKRRYDIVQSALVSLGSNVPSSSVKAQ